LTLTNKAICKKTIKSLVHDIWVSCELEKGHKGDCYYDFN